MVTVIYSPFHPQCHLEGQKSSWLMFPSSQSPSKTPSQGSSHARARGQAPVSHQQAGLCIHYQT